MKMSSFSRLRHPLWENSVVIQITGCGLVIADFSMFRIYTAPDGSPAPYAKENVPLKPKHYLPVSAKGIQDGDFATIMDSLVQPIDTCSYGLQETMDVTNKLRYEIRDVKINVLCKEMVFRSSHKN